MDQNYDPYGYGSNDESRYQRGRRRGRPGTTTGTTTNPPPNTNTNPITGPAHNTSVRTASGRRGSTAPVNPGTGGPRSQDVANRNRPHFPGSVREQAPDRSPARSSLETRGGTVRVTGRVVSCRQSQRRHDFFHVMYDTLVKGARLSFCPVMQVINVELNDMDHTNIDSDSRRTVMVSMVGKIYDGSISVRDCIEVTGQWTPNHTISASSIRNLTNGSRLAVSHAIPANPARVLTAAAVALVVMLVMWLLNGGLSLTGIGNSLMGLVNKIIPYLVLLLLLWWFVSGLRGPFRGVRRMLSRILWLVIGIAVLWYVATAYPALLYALMVLGLMLYGIWLMSTSVSG